MFSLLERLPAHAAVAGGWFALIKSALRIVRKEGVHSFAVKLRRLLHLPPSAKPALIALAAVDVRRLQTHELEPTAQGLRFAREIQPRVSIVIPVFNQLQLSIECLSAIERNPQNTSFEIIVVDDASSDESFNVLPTISGITYLRQEQNAGYIHACNTAIAKATGAYIYFLNNDTQVQREWLDPLVDLLDQRPNVGVVGSMLLFPDGRLQEAGAMLVQSTPATADDLVGVLIGMGHDPADLRYQMTREVEYCSGASLLVRRSLLLSTSGLDDRYAPAYFDDVDLAYAARSAGYSVFYEPRSRVVHHLSASADKHPDAKTSLIARNSRLFVRKWKEQIALNRRIRAIAIYLPQFHPIPENDAWWGKGFTEWTNVVRAKPRFGDHYQPHIPSDLGFYDLRVPEVRQQQADLAAAHGIHGFCYYYYWFNGRRLLHRPLDEVLASGAPDFPFCICWANENWTRTWDGQANQVLLTQQHSSEDDVAFIQSLFPALRDKRYIRINDKPLILVYKVDLLPNIGKTALDWRSQCRQAGIGEIFLACVHNNSNPALNVDPRVIGFDAAVEFPPSGKGAPSPKVPQIVTPGFKGLFYSYTATAENFLQTPCPPYTLFRGVMPSWDNTARRPNSSHVFLDASPKAYGEWLAAAADWTARMHFGDKKIVFLNAWNEWAEGNHLEPDQKNGHAFLDATLSSMKNYLQ